MQISEFQEMMKRLYGDRDKARGVDGTYNWLLEEVAELAKNYGAPTGKPLRKNSPMS